MKYEGVSARLAIERPAAGVIVLRLAGWDTGEFGDAAMKEIARDFAAAWTKVMNADRFDLHR